MRGHEEASGTGYVPPELFDQWREARSDRAVRTGVGRDWRDARDGARRTAPARSFGTSMSSPTGSSTRRSRARRPIASWPASTAPSRVESREPERRRPPIGLRRFATWTRSPTALRLVMRRDGNALLMGQDVAEYGGVFKVTKGFVEEFGKARIRNTPIIESGAIGAGLGLALDGFHPIVEMQYGDFVSCGFNQIVNNLAKTHYRWGAPVPVVVRLPIGGGLHAGPFHSQNVESWFTERGGTESRRARDAVRCQGIADRRLRGRQPRAVSRTQVALSRAEGTRARGLLQRADREGKTCARRARTRRLSRTASPYIGRPMPPTPLRRRGGRSR